MDNDVGQSVIELGSTSSCIGPIYGGLCVLQCGLISLSTFYVLCSSHVCSDCANVAMNGKVKAI